MASPASTDQNISGLDRASAASTWAQTSSAGVSRSIALSRGDCRRPNIDGTRHFRFLVQGSGDASSPAARRGHEAPRFQARARRRSSVRFLFARQGVLEKREKSRGAKSSATASESRSKNVPASVRERGRPAESSRSGSSVSAWRRRAAPNRGRG